MQGEKVADASLVEGAKGASSSLDRSAQDWKNCCRYFEDDSDRTYQMGLQELSPKMLKGHANPPWYAERTIWKAFERVRGAVPNKPAESPSKLSKEEANAQCPKAPVIEELGVDSDKKALVKESDESIKKKEEMLSADDVQRMIDAAIAARLPRKSVAQRRSCSGCLENIAKQ